MNKEPIPTSCPKCGAAIPGDAPEGLCPRCVLAGVATPAEPAARPDQRVTVPPIEAVAAAFPQLEIVELIGIGGMGVVYKARQPNLDRYVALKLLPLSLSSDPTFAERFHREAWFLARLNHPNIVSVYDFGQSGGFCYLLLEFVDGLNLRQAMQAGRFSPAEALVIVPSICAALHYAHDQGVLHRDIKPENILLDTRGRVKIADFGIAKMVREPGASQSDITLTQSGSRLGTPHYMAPEQIEKPSDVDHRADIYSLGVVFYELLTGELPLGRFAPPSEKATLDSRVDAIVMRALAKERELRQQTANEVKTQVEGLASTGAAPIPHKAMSKVTASGEPLPEWAARVTGLFWLAGILAFVPTLFTVGEPVHIFHSGTLLILTAMALHRRTPNWRALAIAVNIGCIALGLVGLCVWPMLAATGAVSDYETGRPKEFMEIMASQTILGWLQMAGFVAGILVLRRPDVRRAFGIRDAESSERLPNPWPSRLFWLVISLILLPSAATIAALVSPRLQLNGFRMAGAAAGFLPMLTGMLLVLGYLQTLRKARVTQPTESWNPWPKRIFVTVVVLVVTPAVLLAIAVLAPRRMARNQQPPPIPIAQSSSSVADVNGMQPVQTETKITRSEPNEGGLPEQLPPGSPSAAALKWHFAWQNTQETRKKLELGVGTSEELITAERDQAIAAAEFRKRPFEATNAQYQWARAMRDMTRRKESVGKATQTEVNAAELVLAQASEALQQLSPTNTTSGFPAAQ